MSIRGSEHITFCSRTIYFRNPAFPFLRKGAAPQAGSKEPPATQEATGLRLRGKWCWVRLWWVGDPSAGCTETPHGVPNSLGTWCYRWTWGPRSSRPHSWFQQTRWDQDSQWWSSSSVPYYPGWEVSELSEPAVDCFVSEHCGQPGELEMLAGTRAGFLGGPALLSSR